MPTGQPVDRWVDTPEYVRIMADLRTKRHKKVDERERARWQGTSRDRGAGPMEEVREKYQAEWQKVRAQKEEEKDAFNLSANRAPADAAVEAWVDLAYARASAGLTSSGGAIPKGDTPLEELDTIKDPLPPEEKFYTKASTKAVDTIKDPFPPHPEGESLFTKAGAVFERARATSEEFAADVDAATTVGECRAALEKDYRIGWLVAAVVLLLLIVAVIHQQTQ